MTDPGLRSLKHSWSPIKSRVQKEPNEGRESSHVPGEGHYGEGTVLTKSMCQLHAGAVGAETGKVWTSHGNAEDTGLWK